MTRIPRNGRTRTPAPFETGVSPFAPLPTQVAATRVRSVFFLIDLIRSGISPGRDDPKAWYDRAIRSVGGAIILLALAFGIVLLVLDKLKAE